MIKRLDDSHSPWRMSPAAQTVPLPPGPLYPVRRLDFGLSLGRGTVRTLDFDDLVTRSPEDMTPAWSRAQRVRALVDANFSFIWRYLRGLGVPAAEVDDATQHVFVIASQKIDAIHDGSERSFLLGTAHGVAANARRAGERRREVSGDDALATLPDASPDAEERAQHREQLAVLDRFLATLPSDLRDVFILFELEGLTMAAIGDHLRLAPGTVASRLRRAREAFQEMAKRFQAARAHESGQAPRARHE